MIVIIDYQVGNVSSVLNMLRKIGTDAVITSNKDLIEKASKLILPGVDAFDYGMSKLNELGMVDLLTKKVLINKTPILGICMGAQLLIKKVKKVC